MIYKPMPWIKVHGELPSHRKSVTLAALVNDPRAWTYAVELWLWASRYAPSGDLGTMPDAAIAAVAGWRGDAVVFVSALRTAGFLDGNTIHDWMEHNGAHFKKQAADKARNDARKTESPTNDSDLASDSLVSDDRVASESHPAHSSLAIVENRDKRIENNIDLDPNLALFADAKVAGEEGKPKPRRGRPPKDRSPEADAERLAEKADADRWLEAAQKLTGAAPGVLRWGGQVFLAFRRARKARGIDQLLRALEGLENDPFSKTAGLGWLISEAGITKGLLKWDKAAATTHPNRLWGDNGQADDLSWME